MPLDTEPILKHLKDLGESINSGDPDVWNKVTPAIEDVGVLLAEVARLNVLIKEYALG